MDCHDGISDLDCGVQADGVCSTPISAMMTTTYHSDSNGCITVDRSRDVTSTEVCDGEVVADSSCFRDIRHFTRFRMGASSSAMSARSSSRRRSSSSVAFTQSKKCTEVKNEGEAPFSPPPPPPPPVPQLQPPQPPPPPQLGTTLSENKDKTQSPKGGLLNGLASKTQELRKFVEKTNLAVDEWEQRLSSLKLADHDLQLVLKLIKEHQNTLGGVFENCLQSVSSMKGLTGLKYLDYLNTTFFEMDADQRSVVGDFLAYIKFPSESLSLYKRTLNKIQIQHFNDTISKHVDEMDSSMKEAIYYVRSHWWNFSDASSVFCANLATYGILQEMVQDMQNVSSASESELKQSFTFESGIGVLHNVSKLTSMRQTFRDLKVVDILGTFLNKDNVPKVTMLVLLTLANIIDENQTDILFAHSGAFDLLLHLARRAWKLSDLRYDGFSLEELLHGLLGLSKNDKVKRLLVDKKVLELLDSILNQGQDKVQLVATKLLWELAFDPENKGKIQEMTSLMGAVDSLSKSDSSKISRSAQGVLWVLDIKKDQKPKKKKKLKGQQLGSSDSGGHVMLSYNWGDQKKLIEVKDMLKAHGYIVWMDIENIKGSTLQAMAEAVEKSAVVLICISETYKESANCRSEAEYAYSLKKPIVPLLMQRSYKPDGWLGILLGTKLFFDFSGKYDFNNKSEELMRELGSLGHGDGTESLADNTDGPIIKEIQPVARKAPPPKLNVSNWLKENQLENIAYLEDLKAEHLTFLKKISSRAPEQYYKILMDFLQGSMTVDRLDTLMKVAQAIDKLPL